MYLNVPAGYRLEKLPVFSYVPNRNKLEVNLLLSERGSLQDVIELSARSLSPIPASYVLPSLGVRDRAVPLRLRVVSGDTEDELAALDEASDGDAPPPPPRRRVSIDGSLDFSGFGTVIMDLPDGAIDISCTGNWSVRE